MIDFKHYIGGKKRTKFWAYLYNLTNKTNKMPSQSEKSYLYS